MRKPLVRVLTALAALTLLLASAACKKDEAPAVPENVLTAATPAPVETEAQPSDDASAVSAAEASVIEQSAVCTSNGVHVRSGPGVDYDDVGTLDADTGLSVTKSFYLPEWHEIWFSGARCYVSAKYIKLSSQPSSVTVSTTEAAQPSVLYAGWVTSSKLNVRKTASTSGHVLGTFYKGDIVSLVSKTPSNGWYQAWFDGQYAFVYAEYVTTELPSSKKATPTPDASGYIVGTVRGSVVALRDAPSLSNSRVLREVKQGVTVYVDYYQGDYYCVRLTPGGTQYYAAKRLISVPGYVPEVIG